jgi:hypothetical protein
MSEYQYYEFVSVDRPLDPGELAELRGVSTRARITPTSFVNTYEWGGGLRVDPRRLMERYFDAFLYLTNWGTHRLMLRFPVTVLDLTTAERYCLGDAASVWQVDDHVILDLVAEDEDGTSEEDWLDGDEGQLASIVPARAAVVTGDRRLLYLAWLLCVQAGEVPDDELEPAVPANLAQLSGSLHSVAAFLRIDDHLLAAGASASTREDVESGSASEMSRWLATVPTTDKDTLLRRVAHGDGALVQVELRARCRQAAIRADPNAHGNRTVKELLTVAEAHREHRGPSPRRRRGRNPRSG